MRTYPNPGFEKQIAGLRPAAREFVRVAFYDEYEDVSTGDRFPPGEIPKLLEFVDAFVREHEAQRGVKQKPAPYRDPMSLVANAERAKHDEAFEIFVRDHNVSFAVSDCARSLYCPAASTRREPILDPEQVADLRGAILARRANGTLKPEWTMDEHEAAITLLEEFLEKFGPRPE